MLIAPSEGAESAREGQVNAGLLAGARESEQCAELCVGSAGVLQRAGTAAVVVPHAGIGRMKCHNPCVLEDGLTRTGGGKALERERRECCR